MDRQFFNTQIHRLKEVYGERMYPEARLLIFWKSFLNTMDETFRDAVDDLIANKRSAPMLEEIAAAVGEARDRDAQLRSRVYSGTTDRVNDGMGGTLIAASQATSETSREFSRACLKLLGEKMAGKYTPEMWEQACSLLEETARGISDKRECSRCRDGYCFPVGKDGYSHLARCGCARGRSVPATLRFREGDVRIPEAAL